MRMKLRGMMLLALAWSCSSTDQTTLEVDAPEPTDLVTDDTPPDDPALEEGVNAALAGLLGDRVHDRLDPHEVSDIDALGDADLDSHAPGDEIDKGNTPIVWGWAVKGFNQMQDGNTTGPDESGATDHCTLFGRSCSNMVHSQALDTSYTGGTGSDFSNDLLGRCGRFDNTIDNSWKPCIVPYGKREGTISPSKAWKWYYDAASCGLEPPNFPLRDLWLEGIALAFQRMTDTDNGYTWTKTTTASQANITFYCSFGEIPSGKIAIGYPYGDITLQYAADHVFNETCESPGGAGLAALHFADMYYTYKKGRIGINWVDWWDWINGCGGTTASKKERISTIMMHEIGHVMGFPHAQLSALNPMIASKTCSWALNAGQFGAWGNYLRALQDYSIDTNSASLSIYDEDISCYSPLGGNESPTD
jgi:hypothetical protein